MLRVQNSATAEDLPEASFAGQQESFLNVVGEEALIDACLRCFASLYSDRAISYREELGFEHARVALSVGVQRMVRSEAASAGVLFTLDPDNELKYQVTAEHRGDVFTKRLPPPAFEAAIARLGLVRM